MDTPGSKRRQRNSNVGGGDPNQRGSGVVSPADIDLNMDPSRDGQSASDRRKQNSQRRSVMGETNPVALAEGSDDEEVDVKKMKVNFDESKQIMALVEEIEEDYGDSKKTINKFDTMALEADCQIKTIKQSYRILKENLYKGNPNFDQEKIEATIHQLKQAVESDHNTLGTLKGEYISTNDAVVNKDVNTFKIDQIKRTRAKQIRVLEKFETVEVDISAQCKKLEVFKHQFHDFENKLFEDQLTATERVVEDTHKFMEEIDNQMDKMTQDILKIKQDISGIHPGNKEQIEKLNKINTDINQVEKILELADEAMERNDQTKVQLQKTHEECKEILQKLDKLHMVDMVSQTRKIEVLVTNLKDWEALYAKLKSLQENSIEVGDFDLAKIMADAKKYIENVAGGRKEEYDDLIRKIQKAAKSIRDGGEEQKQRLDEFIGKNLEGEISSLIPDQDLLFLTKESTRYQGSLKSLQSQKDETLDASTKIDVDMKAKNKGLTIAPEDLHSLRQNLKALEKQLTVDIPRIKKNIDMLEAFAIKALKNKLNEDNKKSQNQISQMKRNYEDLQREIDNLNNKLAKVKDDSTELQKRLDNEDKEKDNDIKFKIEDKLADCDRDINGHKAEQPGEDRDKTKPLSLQARKKDIIAAINKMVNQFNENNKQIKENNKTPKSEKEMNDLINRNKEIQDECKSIDDKVNEGKVFAEQIDERLNNILDPTIPELEAKYEEKNALIDECDDLFDVCEEKLKAVDANLNDQIQKVEASLEKLNDAGPIANPTSSDRDNKEFLQKVSDLTDKGHKLRGDLEGLQTDMQECKDRLMDVIQPLNELGDREVKTPEIQKILEELKKIEAELKGAEAELGETKKETDDLNDEVDKLIESEKNNKIADADEHLGNLDRALADLGDLKKDAMRKLQKYQDMIEAAKNNEGLADPQLLGILKKLEKEAEGIKEQLKDIEAKEKDIKAKREDAKAMIDDAYANPENYTPQQIDGIIDGIGDLRQKVDLLNDKAEKIDQDVDKKIEELKDLLAKNNATKQLDKDIQDCLARMKDDLAALKDLLKKLPEQISKLLETLKEMKLGSTPDETADYWEEKADIDKWIAALEKQQAELKNIQKVFDDKEKKFKDAQANYKKAGGDVQGLTKVLEDVKKESEETSKLLEQAFDCQDVVIGTQKEMNDCQIPVNIRMRANEIDQIRERLDNINDEFKELKAADDAYQGTTESEQDIKKLIEKIDRKLKGFDTEKVQHQTYQKKSLETLGQKEIFGPDNAVIVRDVRNFKEKIADTNRRLKELDEIMRELNNKLIAQDMENAAKLLGQKAENLRKRLEIAKEELGKIGKCGEEMEGNTSHNEEEEFIDALKEEMPEVFKNIEGNFEQLDKIDDLIEEVLKNREIETMQELKGQIDDAQTKVEQCEGLVNKLENEVIEWDAHRKLCKRDEELGEIDGLLKEFKTDMKAEKDILKQGQQKQEDFLKSAKEQNDIDDANYLLEGIKNYENEIAGLENEINALANDRNECFNKFDADIPSSIKVERNKRNAAAGDKKKVAPPTTSDKPEDMYYKLHVNCKYKQPIQELLKELRNINQKRRELMEKYAGLKKDLNVVKAVKVYKAIKGDKVDELWCWHLNKAQIDIDVKRLGPGKYLFGTRNIMCKIINGKLVVRVGGGYMSADEFIEQYGRIEMLKAMKAAGNPDFEEARASLANVGPNARRSGSNPRATAAVSQEMKDQMAAILANGKVYQDAARVTDGRAGSAQKATIGAGKSPLRGGAKSPVAQGSPGSKRMGSAGRK